MPETAKPLGVWDALERVSGLRRVPRGSIDGWHADCPSCQRRGALWITDDERGELRVHCNAGCTRSRVLKAIGVAEVRV